MQLSKLLILAWQESWMKTLCLHNVEPQDLLAFSYNSYYD